MRHFFLLAEDANQTGVHAVIPTYPVFGPFDSTEVCKCRRLPDDYLQAGQLQEKPGKKVDLVGNPMGWPIVSPAMMRVFEDMAMDDIQCLIPNIVDASGARVLEEYRVVNALRLLTDTIDLDKSVTSRHKRGDREILNIITPAFCVDRIPTDVHVFRPKESLFHLVVSEEFAEAIQEAKLKGIALIETGSV